MRSAASRLHKGFSFAKRFQWCSDWICCDGAAWAGRGNAWAPGGAVRGKSFSHVVLDLGCGWGAIGVAVKKKYPAAHVTMVDVNRRALELCRFNAVRNGITAECLESDGMAEVMERTFDFIITNPPIRASKPVIYRMFADAASRLNPGGALYLVIRKQQGAESCMKYLKTLYAKVDKVDKSGGFWVLRATEPLKKENEAQEEAADAHV